MAPLIRVFPGEVKNLPPEHCSTLRPFALFKGDVNRTFRCVSNHDDSGNWNDQA